MLDCGGLDQYTGEELDWKLMSQYNNDESKELGREYKKRHALLPTVDHVGDGTGPADFKICSWRTNDCKNDLTIEELRDFCITFLRAQGYQIEHAERPAAGA